MLGYITDQSAPNGIIRRELPDPRPAPDDVLIEVEAFSVNRGELALLQQRPDGWSPGQDVSGVVRQAAASGRGPTAGTRVVGLADGGSWSAAVPVPVHRVAPLPEQVSSAEAAALPVAGLTALRALRTGGPLLGRRVLVTGATGGVGHLAVQLARAGGANVTALVHRHEHAAAATGAAHEVRTNLDSVAEPFDVVVDGVGGDVLVAALHHLAPGGTLTAYGRASGSSSTLSFVDFASAPLGRLVGFFLYGSGEETFGADLGALADLVAERRLRVETGPPRTWDDLPAALEELLEHRVTGKVVLTRRSAG